MNRKSTFEVFKIINLPIPYPEVGGKGVVVAWYKLETENIVFNVERTKFMLLTPEEVMTCRMNVLGTCPSMSATYANVAYQLCVLGLFKGKVDIIKENCQVETTSKMLTQALVLSDGIWP